MTNPIEYIQLSSNYFQVVIGGVEVGRVSKVGGFWYARVVTKGINPIVAKRETRIGAGIALAINCGELRGQLD